MAKIYQNRQTVSVAYLDVILFTAALLPLFFYARDQARAYVEARALKEMAVASCCPSQEIQTYKLSISYHLHPPPKLSRELPIITHTTSILAHF